ncbi:hypothetical protein [Streptomyces silvensis]|uniref:Uncharacterized protein n=1 Tax=Streptomyces silvensis TaxID=1765722 RepID=A0A0W7X6N3_9ACTN|nr:hypothetical protein [Streptomyces silvensis]KUF18420.1 hypothetical protein AT728_18905 [Streptomyces silvensis]
MNIRPDIAELLRAGLSDRAIAARLGVDATKTVAPARRALGLPTARSGRKPAATPEALFWQRVQPTDGGHLIWTGSRCRASGAQGGCPTLRYGGRQYSAWRIAFRLRYGRAPEGKVALVCGVDGCVAPDHTEDRRIRERTSATFDAIFGGAS